MDPQLLLSQAADLERPPTQQEVETELATPGKSGRGRSSSSRGPLSNARGGDRGLAVTRSELHEFQDSMKGELEDVKAMVKQLLQEVQKRTTGPLEPSATAEAGADVAQAAADKVACAFPLIVASSTCLEPPGYSNVVCHVEVFATKTRLTWIIRACRQWGSRRNPGILGRLLYHRPCVTPYQKWAGHPTL